MPFSTPVVLIIFRRFESTKRVFDAIRAAKPPVFLILGDGPRNAEEAEACQRVRDYVLNNIDWDCDVSTLFAEENMGIRRRFYTGFNWVLYPPVQLGVLVSG